MNAATSQAIVLLVQADPLATDSERSAIMAISRSSEWYPSSVAAQRLGCSIRWLRHQVSASMWHIQRKRVSHRVTLYRAEDVEQIRGTGRISSRNV